jgi:chromosomal replication initiation ATPase DnaA
MSDKLPSGSGQLVFELAGEPRFGIDDFLVAGPNERAFCVVEAWPQWPGRVLLLIGPSGAGKSHLAAIWAKRSHAKIVPAQALPRTDLPGLARGGAVVIDGAENVGVSETALFHLLNLLREAAAFALITGCGWPTSWGIRTADLLSRLRQAPIVELGEPDDALVRAVLVKLFTDRQLAVDTSVVDYIALRIDRSLAAARGVVAALDREALARNRRITRPMAAEVLHCLLQRRS